MNKEDVNHDFWRDHASEYERGFIDGMQRQAQSSVDKAVNAMSAAPVQEQLGPQEILQMIVDRALEKSAAQRQWVGLMRGVRVDGDSVIVSTKSNDAARQLCGELLRELNGGQA